VHPLIDNPDYQPDPNLAVYDDIGAVGFDLWQVKSGSIFDNIIITDSVDEAKAFYEETTGKTIAKEIDRRKTAQEEEAKRLAEEEKKREEEAKAAAEEDEDEEEEEEEGKDEL